MDKLHRNYRLMIGPTSSSAGETSEILDDSVITIEPPFTIDFDVSRNTLASTNIASIRIYNLSENIRKKIYRDEYRHDIYIPVSLMAGYGDNLPKIFAGNISHAWSVREGVNFVTTIEAFDGGDALVNAQINQPFKAGTSKQQVIASTLEAMKAHNVTIGAVGSFPGSLARGNTLSGNAAQIANTLSDDAFFIDLQQAYCLNPNECIRGAIQVINSESGLLGTPVISRAMLSLDMIFEPRIMVAQKVYLESSTAKSFTNFYKVTSIHHRGTISDAVCGNAITTLGMFVGDKELQVVN